MCECKRFIELAHDIGALGVKVRPNGIPKEVPEAQTIAPIGAALCECGGEQGRSRSQG